MHGTLQLATLALIAMSVVHGLPRNSQRLAKAGLTKKDANFEDQIILEAKLNGQTNDNANGNNENNNNNNNGEGNGGTKRSVRTRMTKKAANAEDHILLEVKLNGKTNNNSGNNDNGNNDNVDNNQNNDNNNQNSNGSTGGAKRLASTKRTKKDANFGDTILLEANLNGNADASNGGRNGQGRKTGNNQLAPAP